MTKKEFDVIWSEWRKSPSAVISLINPFKYRNYKFSDKYGDNLSHQCYLMRDDGQYRDKYRLPFLLRHDGVFEIAYQATCSGDWKRLKTIMDIMTANHPDKDWYYEFMTDYYTFAEITDVIRNICNWKGRR